MDMQNGTNTDENLEAPPKLVAALRQLPSAPVFVPPTVDEALMKAARRQLGRPDKKRPVWFRLMPWTVATAGLAAAILLAYPHAKEFFGSGPSTFSRSAKGVQRGSENTAESAIPPQRQGLANVREDLNHDGKVDILDAFMLAKKLQGAPVLERTLDLNGDGVVDQRDVEIIAVHAVSLEKRGRS
jgi:Dockerin type I domain